MARHAIKRGVAGRTHCGSWRYVSDEDRELFGFSGLRLACTAPPHGSESPHRNRFWKLKWQRDHWSGALERDDATAES